MKKVFQSAIVLSLLLLSCTDEADITENVTGVVGFHATDVASSRAAILDTDILKSTGFRVNAYATGLSNWDVAGSTTKPEFMHNEKVKWETDKWTYGPPAKYWPGKVDGTQYGKVSFFAWNEGTGATVSGNDETGVPQLTYTVQNAHADQHDLVTAMEPNLTADINNGAVALSFGHVLSRIGFTARLDKHYDDKTITITSLKVKYITNKVQSKGIYTFGETKPWLPTGEVYMSHTGDELVGPAGVPLNNDETPAKMELTSADAENYLMLLPQIVEAGGVELYVAWKVVGDGTGGPGDPYSDIIYLPKQTWEAGKRYDYNLTVLLTEVRFDMTISAEEWAKENGAYYPCNVTFDANGGTGANITRPWITGVKYPIQEDDDTFTPKPDHILGGWNTKADGNGANYQPGESFTCDEDITLYAKWVKPEIHDDPALSNCYMITPGEPTDFPVLRAYAHNGARFTNTLHTGERYNGEFEAAVVWDDAGVIDEVEVEKSGKDAVVKVKTTNTSPDGGNALVKIYKKSDNVNKTPVWSYHIWVTDYVPEVGVNTWTNPNSTSFTFMNRNLGATAHNLSDAPKTYGLFYQWGRKDPFPGSCEGSAGWPSGGFDPGFDGLGTGGTTLTGTNANGIISSIKNPQHFYLGGSVNNWLPAIDDNLWNDQTTNQKTIYDPCPSGWRVPRFLNNTNDENHSPWKGYTSTDTEDKWGSWDLSSNALTGGMIFGSTTNAQYPGAGYRGYGKGASGDAGAVGHLWCATSQNSGNVIILRYANTGQSALHTSPVRASGFSVRCVQE